MKTGKALKGTKILSEWLECTKEQNLVRYEVRVFHILPQKLQSYVQNSHFKTISIIQLIA